MTPKTAAPRPTVLVVDDEPDLVETLRFRLAATNRWTVLTAADGLEALDMVAAHHPELILLDVMMPEENGYRVSRAIREAEAAGRLPHRATILLLTARDLREDPEREQIFADFSRADDVLYKPYELEALVERVAGYLEG